MFIMYSTQDCKNESKNKKQMHSSKLYFSEREMIDDAFFLKRIIIGFTLIDYHHPIIALIIR